MARILIFKPPCNWADLTGQAKSDNNWLIHNFHWLSWESGDISYNQIIEAFKLIRDFDDNLTVWVKGEAKKKLATTIFQ